MREGKVINVMKNVVNIINVCLPVLRIKLTLVEPSPVCFLLNSLHFANRSLFWDFQELSETNVLFLCCPDEIKVLFLLSLPEIKVLTLAISV